MKTKHTLSALLKEATQIEHQKIESCELMQNLVADNFSYNNYVLLLQKLISFYKPLEESFKKFLDMGIMHYHYIEKLSLLKKDLMFASNGVSQTNIKDAEVISINKAEDFIGALYVVEGSTLGGNIISKKLQRHIDTENSASFFCPYGDKTGKLWQETKEFINNSYYLDNKAVCEAAIATFQSMQIALNEPLSIKKQIYAPVPI